jgi:hypothetical protein
LENYVSSLSRAARLANGSIAIVDYDVEFDQRSGTPATADGWVTVLDPTFRRACVDAPLPLASPSLPSLSFRGDTLFTLEHVIAGTRSTPVVRAFAISTADCTWMPVERG